MFQPQTHALLRLLQLPPYLQQLLTEGLQIPRFRVTIISVTREDLLNKPGPFLQ